MLKGCRNNTECDALLINSNSRTDTYPAITVRGNQHATQRQHHRGGNKLHIVEEGPRQEGVILPQVKGQYRAHPHQPGRHTDDDRRRRPL